MAASRSVHAPHRAVIRSCIWSPGRQAHGQQGERRQSGHRADDGAGPEAAGQGHDQRDDDRRVGVDAQPVHRRHRDQGPAAATEDRRGQRAELRRSRRPAAGARRSRTRSTAARRRRWRTSPRSPTCSPAASRASRRMPVQACSQRPPGRPEATPADTLTAAQSIAQYPWYQPERVFALLDAFYPVPKGKNLRPVPYMPYLQFSPSAWVLPLKFDGGGYRAGGKAMFDTEGNLWVGDNFTVGWQANDALWQGNATQVRPQRQAAVADHHRLHRRRHGGRHLRRGRRPEGQRLAVELWQQVHHRVRQGRQAADAARRHQLRRPARPDAGHHRRAQRRRVGVGRLQAPAAALPQGRLEERPDRLRGRQCRAVQVVHGAVPPGHRPAGPDLGIGQLVPCHPLPGRRPEQGREVRRAHPTTAGSTSTARATSG